MVTSSFNKNSRDYALGKWVETSGAKAFTQRGHTLLVDHSESYLKYPDQAWLLKGGKTKVFIEYKGFSQPDLWRKTGKYQIGVSENQYIRYVNLLSENPDEKIFYALWIGKYQNQTGKMYIIPIDKLVGTADHSSSTEDKTNKIPKSLFYNMDYIQSESIAILDVPLDANMCFESYVKDGDARHPKERVVFN